MKVLSIVISILISSASYTHKDNIGFGIYGFKWTLPQYQTYEYINSLGDVKPIKIKRSMKYRTMTKEMKIKKKNTTNIKKSLDNKK